MSQSTSFVSLHDSRTCWRDPDARSIGFFASRPTVCVSRTVLDEIKQMIQQTGKTVRLSLHQSPNAAFHEMIIGQPGGQYNRPKKAIGKVKSFHIFEGEMAVFVFNDDGAVIDACVLDGKHALVYRVNENMYYSNVPLTDLVLFQESTVGPFLRDNEARVYAPFSPAETDRTTCCRYMDSLLALIDR